MNPSEAASRWASSVQEAQKRYMWGISPQDEMEMAKRLYVEGRIDHTHFEAKVDAILRREHIEAVSAIFGPS